MALFARKICGSVSVTDSNKHHISLVEIANQNSTFLEFILFIKIVSSVKIHPAKKKAVIIRLMYLEEKEVDKAIRRYFSPHGGVAENVPGINDERWKVVRPWFLGLANITKRKSGWIRIHKSYHFSRPKSGTRFFGRYAPQRVLLLIEGKK